MGRGKQILQLVLDSVTENSSWERGGGNQLKKAEREGGGLEFSVQIRRSTQAAHLPFPRSPFASFGSPHILLLLSRIPPIDRQRHPSDVGRIIAGQKHGASRDILDVAPLTPRRRGRDSIARWGVFEDGLRHRRFEI